MIDKIQSQLARFGEITDWKIQHRHVTSYQIYVIGDWLDTLRKVVTDRYVLTIYSLHGNYFGSTDLSIYAHEIPTLEKRLKKAIFVTSKINNRPFSLQAPLNRYPFVETFDPTLLGNLEELLFVNLADHLIESVNQEKKVRLSSAEFFVEATDIHYLNSRGIDLKWSETEIMFDGVLLSGDQPHEIELHFEPRARRLQDLPIPEIISRKSRFVIDSVTATLPPSGVYPVVVTDEALTGILAPLIQHTSAQFQHRNISRFVQGQPICSVQKGDPLTLISNAFIPFGLKTRPIDSDGIPARRFEIIRNGIFETPWSSKQYADYMNIEPTGLVSNIEIPIGHLSTRNLLCSDSPVLQVVAFSAMMPDTISGNFAAEIKLAYLHRNGQAIPIRGGSVSGNLLTGFNHAFFSTESELASYSLVLDQFGSYRGPSAIRFEQFQVSGV